MAVSSTNNTTSTTGTSDTSVSALAASSAEQLSQQFLTMLTAQMQNQDPLNPLDNAELTSQLAQISTVSGISQLNTTMQWLGYSMGSLQATQALSLIGHQVLLAGNSMTLADGQAAGGYNLSDAVSSATVQVYNSSGAVVDSFSAPTDAGVHSFTWDGTDSKGNTLADGNYTFQVQIVSADGSASGTATALSVSQIASVQPSSGSTKIIDNAGTSVDLSDVYQVW